MRLKHYVFIGIGAFVVLSNISAIGRMVNPPANGGWNPDPIYWSVDVTCLNYKPVRQESNGFVLQWGVPIAAKDVRGVALGWCKEQGYDSANDKPSTQSYRPGVSLITKTQIKWYIDRVTIGIIDDIMLGKDRR